MTESGWLPTRVLLPLDGTPASTRALPVARQLAKRAHATLHILHVADHPLAPDELRRALGLTNDQIANAVLECSVGEPAAGIAQAARGAPTLIVMTMRAAGRASRTGLGSVAEGVLRRCMCPLVLMSPEHEHLGWQLRHVLLPQDGTSASAAAVAPAVALTRRVGASLSVIHVSTGQAPSQAPGTMGVPRYVDQPQHEWPAWAREFVERVEALSCRPEEVGARFFLASGEPAPEIVRAAREHDVNLIVLAWHGNLDAEHARTVKAVLRDAHCPILILPFAEFEAR